MTWMNTPIMKEFIQLLAFSIGGYVLCIIVSKILSGGFTAKLRIRLGQSLFRMREKGKASSLTLSWLMSIAIVCWLCIYAYSSRSTKVTQHNVAIHAQLENGDFVMSSDEEESLVFRPCQDDIQHGVDVNGLLTQGIGYVADYASWEERGTCKSILQDDLGFWFRTENNKFTYKRVQK